MIGVPFFVEFECRRTWTWLANLPERPSEAGQYKTSWRP